MSEETAEKLALHSKAKDDEATSTRSQGESVTRDGYIQPNCLLYISTTEYSSIFKLLETQRL